MKIDGVEITRALIIDDPWISKILSGEKTWEMRSTRTNVRGFIGLIRKGSGKIVGIANLHHCGERLATTTLIKSKRMHCVDYKSNPELLKWHTPWSLRDVKEINPIPYEHKQGAVVWVKI